MPPWIKIASLRHALSLGRHRIEAASDAINLIDRARDTHDRNTPTQQDAAPQAASRSRSKGRSRS